MPISVSINSFLPSRQFLVFNLKRPIKSIICSCTSVACGGGGGAAIVEKV